MDIGNKDFENIDFGFFRVSSHIAIGDIPDIIWYRRPSMQQNQLIIGAFGLLFALSAIISFLWV